MTRGRGIIFVKNLNNEIEAYESTEYNGDMFPEEEANGAEYFDKLKKVNNLKDFIEMNKEFNRERYQYPENLAFKMLKGNGVSFEEYCKYKNIDNEKDKIVLLRVFGNSENNNNENWGDYFQNDDGSYIIANSEELKDKYHLALIISDYYYIKNLTGETISVYQENGNYDLKPNDILISNFNDYFNENYNCEVDATSLNLSRSEFTDIGDGFLIPTKLLEKLYKNERDFLRAYKTSNGSYDIEQEICTPLGEDWVETYNDVKNFDELGVEIEDRYKSFDVDDEAEIWIESRGRNGVPSSIQDLLDDAKWKEEELYEFSDIYNDFINNNKDFYLKALNTIKSFSEKEDENERG